MAKDMNGNDLNAGDQVTIEGAVGGPAPPPPDDNALIQVTLTTMAPDGSPTSVEVWSGQVRRVASAPPSGQAPGQRPQSQNVPGGPHGSRPVAQPKK